MTGSRSSRASVLLGGLSQPSSSSAARSLYRWYAGLPREWIIETSANGWMTNDLGVRWLKHFDAPTKEHTVGVYRLLIVDGHESHAVTSSTSTVRNRRLSLCMPSHLSHLLQPLDVCCFAPLKRAYYANIDSWARYLSRKSRKRPSYQPFTLLLTKQLQSRIS